MLIIYFKLCFSYAYPIIYFKLCFSFQISQKASEEQWLAKFELSKDHLPKLTPTDIVDLASELAFSEDAYTYVPRRCRLLFLEDILKFCRGRQQM
jgi:hypothetical protein